MREMGNAYEGLTEIPDGKKVLGITGRRWEKQY